MDIREPLLRDEMLTMMENKNIPELKFILVKFNSYCPINTNRPPVKQTSLFLPAEIGLAAFSVSEGVIDQYSTMIDPGQSSPGNYNQLSKLCNPVDPKDKDSPKFLTMPGYDKKYQDIPKILDNVEEFVRKHSTEGEPLTLFCRDEELDSSIGCLIWLFENGSKDNHARRDTVREFSLKPLELLVFTMARFAYANRRAPPPKYIKDPREKATELLSKLDHATGYKAPVTYQLEEQLDYCGDTSDLTQEGKFRSLKQAKKYLTSFRNLINLQLPCSFHEKTPTFDDKHCALTEVIGQVNIIKESMGRLFDII